jgi:hypothetical protein
MYAARRQGQASDFPMTAAKRTKKPTKAEVAARIRGAGERAKVEAEARRRAQAQAALPKEIGGQKGPEPTRYGDWEKKGITSDF